MSTFSSKIGVYSVLNWAKKKLISSFLHISGVFAFHQFCSYQLDLIQYKSICTNITWICLNKKFHRGSWWLQSTTELPKYSLSAEVLLLCFFVLLLSWKFGEDRCDNIFSGTFPRKYGMRKFFSLFFEKFRLEWSFWCFTVDQNNYLYRFLIEISFYCVRNNFLREIDSEAVQYDTFWESFANFEIVWSLESSWKLVTSWLIRIFYFCQLHIKSIQKYFSASFSRYI